MRRLKNRLRCSGKRLQQRRRPPCWPKAHPLQGKVSEGQRIEIMGFEVANVIVRAINLRQSLLERDIEDLRAEVLASEGIRMLRAIEDLRAELLASEGIRMLVSDDFYHVWCIAAEDKRCVGEGGTGGRAGRMVGPVGAWHTGGLAGMGGRAGEGELRAVARDVARLGKQCLDPALHSLTQAFDALGTMDGPKGRMTSVEVEGELRALEGQAQITAVSGVESPAACIASKVEAEGEVEGGEVEGGAAGAGGAGADHSGEWVGSVLTLGGHGLQCNLHRSRGGGGAAALEGQAQITT
ncbi:unnamed protein product, partial [Closterium sp. NIES-65]